MTAGDNVYHMSPSMAAVEHPRRARHNPDAVVTQGFIPRSPPVWLYHMEVPLTLR